MGYTNVQADVNFYRQSLNADGVKYVTGPYTSLYEDVFRAVTVTTDSVVSVTSYVGDSLSNQFLLAGTEIYGLFSSVTIHSGKAVLHLAGASYISEIINQYSASGIPLGFYEEGTQCLTDKINRLLTQGLFDDASWVMVPSQYEEDWVRAFKPTSELGNLAFTRSSDATYTDASGLVRRSPYNLFQQSETFSNAVWTKGNSSVTSNAAISPNGFTNASKIIPNTTSGAHNIYQSVNVTATPYTLSFYAKKDGYTGIRVADLATGIGARFNLLNGSLGIVSSGVTASIQSLANDWYRCSITFTPIAGTQLYGIYVDQSVNVSSYSGDGISGIFIWGAQLVEGTEALPYFATTDRLNVPRLDYRNADGTLSTCPRLLLEPQRTNSIRNSSMVGAVAGTPGTLPTNWTNVLSGLTQTVVGVGTENGLPYIDFRFNGTATNTTCELRFETNTQIAALTGQVWTLSTYAKVISGTFNSASLFMFERTSAGIAVASGSQVVTVTSTLQRLTYTRTLSGGATVGAVQPAIVFFITNGAAYDFTIRIAAPQMELGAYATTWVPTTTTAVTRIADAASKTGVSSLIGQTEGTMFIDFYHDISINASSDSRFQLSDGSTANWIFIGFPEGNSKLLRFRVANSGSAVNFFSNTNIIQGRNKVVFAYKNGDFVGYLNGVQVASNTTALAIPSCSRIDLQGASPTNPALERENIAQAAIFPVRLDNATLAALTTL